MVKIESYMQELIGKLQEKFAERLLYVGLQGSYLRREETENSDIDVMVVIEGLCVADLDAYRNIIGSMDEPDKACGFICSGLDLANWNPLEISNLIHGTKDCFGKLRPLVPAYTEQDMKNYIKISLNNLYHELCHRYIHADRNTNLSQLPCCYKGVFFILQNLHHLRYGDFIPSQAELLTLLSGRDRAVLERAARLGEGGEYDFQDSFELLFCWCQDTLIKLSN
ncbi:MAG: nucleotidyltransferase domain-containing protein [Clostridia bacterium]|nr:nucleotidyltransferase domain-containing protein [Clostridia bacterium]